MGAADVAPGFGVVSSFGMELADGVGEPVADETYCCRWIASVFCEDFFDGFFRFLMQGQSPVLVHALSGFCAFVYGQGEDVFPSGTSGENHAFGDAKLHFSGGEVGDHDHFLADEFLGLVGLTDAGENRACLAAKID